MMIHHYVNQFLNQIPKEEMNSINQKNIKPKNLSLILPKIIEK
jgi:hypothetical protein